MVDDIKLLNLQFFAEGGDGAGAGDGGDSGVNGTQEVAAPVSRRARRENPLANMQFGVVDEPAPDSQVAADTTAADDGETFEKLIGKGGKYEKEFRQRTQDIVSKRHGDYKHLQGRLNGYNQIGAILAERYGIDASDPANLDIEALTKALNEDRALYEEEAYREGVPVEMLMKSKQLERQQAAIDAERRAAAEQQRMQAEFLDLQQQAVSMQERYPGFNLEAEMTNPAFGRLVLKAPRGSGLSVEAAYHAIHHNEIMQAQQAQRYQYAHDAVQAAQQRTANAIASGSRRPAENGVSTSAAAVHKTDPRTLTKAERAEIRRRVSSGAVIRWD